MTVGRRRARREALFVLYQQDLMGLSTSEALSRYETSSGRVDPYTALLVEGVGGRLREIDATLEGHLHGWELGRLAPLERSLLRMSVFELLWTENTPDAVVINEAVELAKRFSSEEASILVNGVLGAIQAGKTDSD